MSRAAVSLMLFLPIIVSCGDPADPPAVEECSGPTAVGICLDVVATGLRFPLALEQPPGEDRVFVAEQVGRIRIIRAGELEDGAFLDVTSLAVEGPERGLLGFAFHPEFASNGHLFVVYTDADGNVHLDRFTVGADPDRVDLASRQELLLLEREAGPHNGGRLVFGPDGMLYMGVGDGNEPWNAQDSTSFFGSILRIDVHGGDPYAIPPDNPYVGAPGAREEIWATGLRNPWRFSFEDGRLFVADVGQAEWEELNVVDAAEPGLDFGWPIMEASACFATTACDSQGLVLPALEYDHTLGCSIIGGGIYREVTLPNLTGRYLYGDYCGWIASAAQDGETITDAALFDFDEIGLITSFGFDADGEPWALFHGGDVARLVPAPAEEGTT